MTPGERKSIFLKIDQLGNEIVSYFGKTETDTKELEILKGSLMTVATGVLVDVTNEVAVLLKPAAALFREYVKETLGESHGADSETVNASGN